MLMAYNYDSLETLLELHIQNFASILFTHGITN